jgi:hypothetical protein
MFAAKAQYPLACRRRPGRHTACLGRDVPHHGRDDVPGEGPERDSTIRWPLIATGQIEIENHEHIVALYTVWYNWIRTHKAHRVTPAMAP